MSSDLLPGIYTNCERGFPRIPAHLSVLCIIRRFVGLQKSRSAPRDLPDLYLDHCSLPECLIGISVRPFRILTHDDIESRSLLTEILDEVSNPVSDHASVTHCPTTRGLGRDGCRVYVELEAHVTVFLQEVDFLSRWSRVEIENTRVEPETERDEVRAPRVDQGKPAYR